MGGVGGGGVGVGGGGGGGGGGKAGVIVEYFGETYPVWSVDGVAGQKKKIKKKAALTIPREPQPRTLVFLKFLPPTRGGGGLHRERIAKPFRAGPIWGNVKGAKSDGEW